MDGKRKKLLAKWLAVGFGLIVVVVVCVPSFMRFHMVPKTPPTVEATSNLAAIRTCQETYFSEKGIYLECKPSPPDGGTDAEPDEWVDAGGFTEIGFAPDGRVRYQYTVTVSEDGQSFVSTATGDLDEDGKRVVYTIDKKADTFPKPIRTGDREKRYSLGKK